MSRNNTLSRLRKVIVNVSVSIAFCYFAGAANGWGQITNVTNDQATPVPGVGHDYIGSINDVVSPSNGSLSIRLGVQMPHARGLSLPFSFNYDSAGNIIVHGIPYVTCTPDGALCQYSDGRLFAGTATTTLGGGWGYNLPQLTADAVILANTAPISTPAASCPVYTGFLFTDLAGSRHSMTGMALADVSEYSSCAKAGITPMTYQTGSDEFYKAYAPSGATDPTKVSLSVVDNAGTLFHFPLGQRGPFCVGWYCEIPDYVEDKNGNTLSISVPTANNGFPISVTDTAGRNVLSISSYGSASGDTVSVSGPSVPYTVQWATVPYNYSIASTLSPDNPSSCDTLGISSSSGTRRVISSIALPNGETYSFTYDPTYGLLNKITYPSGAYISYLWGPSDTPSDLAPYALPNTNAGVGIYIAPVLLCAQEYNSISIRQRTVSFDGVNIAQKQTFGYSTTWGHGVSPMNGATIWKWLSKSTTVTTTDNLSAGSPSYQTIYTYTPAWVPDPPNVESQVASYVPQENTTTYMDWSGAVLQTVTKTWVNPGAQSSLLSSEQTALSNGQVSLTNYSYVRTGSAALPVMTEKDEYGYGAGVKGALARKTVTSYATFSNTPLATSLGNLPCKSTVYDGGGNRISETDTLYDGGTAVCGTAGTPSVTAVSGMPTGTHDETNFSASSIAPRGNPTKVSRKCFAGSASCTDASTSYTYDETGQMLSAVDPCGNATCADVQGTNHTTRYSYADNPSSGNLAGNSNTYPTTITDALGHTKTFAYDYTTGHVISSSDGNVPANTTRYKYNTPPSGCSTPDGLVRLSEVDYPDGGVTTYCYDDSVPQISTSQLLTGSTWKTSLTKMDGMGHVIKTIDTDSSGNDTTDTTYNGMGQVQSVSNPYRSTSDPTYGLTTSTYDTLGRKVSQTAPDGTSTQTWSYSGNTTTYTDENQNQWLRTSDALGRLIQVFEPNGIDNIPAMETDYTYDALDKLLTVNQKGFSRVDTARTARTFSYDSLSRLLCASNPENSTGTCPVTSTGTYVTGTTGYVYDANGNVSTKTDPRNIVVSYKYDSLNRLYAKNYSSSDPSACMQYDQAATIGSDTNPVGRLTLEWTGPANSCPTTSSSLTSVPTTAYNSSVILGHDAMGRVTGEQQCPYASGGICTSSAPFAYTYDLAGSTTSFNNGMPTATNSATSPAITWGINYSNAEQIASVTATAQPWTDAAHPAMLLEANAVKAAFSTTKPYDPWGHLVYGLTGLSADGQPAGLKVSSTYDKRGRITMEQALGLNSPAEIASGSFGVIAVNGSEQSVAPPVAATDTVTISGHEQSYPNDCPSNDPDCPRLLFDTGSVTVNGATATYGQGDSPTTVAQSVAVAINTMPSSGLKASANGSAVNLTAITPGTSGNQITVSVSSESDSLGTASFTGAALHPTLTGGLAVGPVIYDQGSVQVVITKGATNVTAAPVSWGNGSTAQSLASAISSAINTASAANGNFLTAAVDSNNHAVNLSSTATGSTVNYPVSLNITDNSNATYFPTMSFTFDASSTTGGQNAYAANSYGPIYTYIVPAGGYAPNSNLLAHSDTIMGDWAFQYDTLNRLTWMFPAANVPSGYQTAVGCYGYDGFGNRTVAALTVSDCYNASLVTASYTASNRVNFVATSAPGGFTYDGAGNVTNDGRNNYAYDAEGRLCAVQVMVGNAVQGQYQYLYNASGLRVGRASFTGTFPGANSTCAAPGAAGGFSLSNQYLLDLSGNQVTELNTTTTTSPGTMAWAHSNVWAGSHLNATYDSLGLHFHLSDPLGTRRVQTNYKGAIENTFQSLPFGDGLVATPTALATADDATENHFTGKERDTESGNDYFGARYYASSMGRFMSPDWSAAPDTIPYGDLRNPQSLNLYSYVLNNPLKSTDSDGHTHQECTKSQSSSQDADGTIHVTVREHCADVPDWWNFGTNISNSYNRFKNWVNSNVEAHRPPPQKSNGMEALQDINNLMMGVQAVPFSPKFGFQGGAKFRQALKELMQPGTHETVAGEVPTRAEATDMIQRAGGQVTRGGAGEPMDPGEEFGHDPGGVSDHTYPHINYETASGVKATVKVSNE